MKAYIALVVLCLFLHLSTPATADPYPAKPVKLVVGYSAGGPADAAARHLAAIVSQRWGQRVIVLNTPGAAGSIAATAVARAAADGYTLLYGTSDFVMYPILHTNVTYDPMHDFAPVTGISKRALLLAVTPSLGVKSVQELISRARAKPGTLTYESSGVGSIEHLAGEVFQRTAEIELVHVPYKGSAPAIIDLIAGQVQMAFEIPVAIVGHIRSGKLVPLMTTAGKRLTALPQVPTAHEVGMPAMDLRAPWAGIVVPAGTPKARIARINAVFGEARNVKGTIESAIFEDSLSITGTPDEFGAFIRSESSRWTKIIKDSRINVD